MIVGLGNPGQTYLRHRHNIGFLVLDLLGERHGIEMRKRSFGALTGSGAIEGEAIILVKPQTFMNISGDAVVPLLGYYKMEPENLIVVHDDLDIELGKIKLALAAGHGGHNGIRSIIDLLGRNDFFRVRVGIGRPPAYMDAADYVLQPFKAEEEKAAKETVVLAADAVETIISQGLSKAQQKYH